MITIEGDLAHITYYNRENHYTIARLKPFKNQSPITIVGFMPGVSLGQSLKVKGNWETHAKYGQQFKIDIFEVTLPATVDGIREYLKSGVIKGIGKKTANRLVNHFGAKTLEVIENKPEKIIEVDGIGKAKADLIGTSWKEHHAVRDLMQFLQDQGVKASYSAVILKEYGSDAVKIIRTDPFRLADDIPIIGFIIADTITRNQGVEKNDPKRIRACINYILKQYTEDGHVFGHEDLLLDRCQELFDIDHDKSRNILADIETAGEVVIQKDENNPETNAVYLKHLFQAETDIATRARALFSVPVALPEVDRQLISKEILKKLAIKLSTQQLEVLEKVLAHRIVIITGGPGTGKTTLIRSITALLEALGKQILLAAPTGRAARRLSDVTNREAKTIHRLLGYNFKDNLFEKNQDDPLDANAVIIDETSMVDTLLMSHLVKAVPVTSVLILVGDAFQLPSVGPGNVLADMINSDVIPVFYLTEIFRQAKESPIVVNAHMVRKGAAPDMKRDEKKDSLSEFYFIEQSDPAKVVETIVELCSKRIPKSFNFDPMDEVQVLTPMHKGAVGTLNLNQVLQKALNPNPIEIEGMGSTFKTGDKVMHLKNNYQKEVFNGDIGTIKEIHKKKKQIYVNYYGRDVAYGNEELGEISLAYAISVHKSQGSEYPAVVVPIMTQHYVLLQRNLLYTAMTRGKKLVILIGTKKAFHIALNNDKPQKRLSGLAQKLRDGLIG